MAAVTRATSCKPAIVPGYEVNDKGQAATAIVAGDLLVLTATTPSNGYGKVWAKAPTTGILEADGIALMDAKSGAIVSVGIQGEMEYGTGMTPGAPLYPSVATAGVLATDAIVGATVRIKAVSTTRIRYSFV